MMGVRVAGSADEQTIAIVIETYLSILTAPSNRTYMDSERYDAGDMSGRATIAIANSTGGGGINPGTGGGGVRTIDSGGGDFR
jgi:hypothetical protein